MNLHRARRRARDRTHHPHDEAGFTLAELIVSISIEAIIFGALATAFVVLLHSGTSINENLARSSDARFGRELHHQRCPQFERPGDLAREHDAVSPIRLLRLPNVRTRRALRLAQPQLRGVSTANLANYVLVSAPYCGVTARPACSSTNQVLATNIATVGRHMRPNTDCTGDPKVDHRHHHRNRETVVDVNAPVVGAVSFTLTARFVSAPATGSALPRLGAPSAHPARGGRPTGRRASRSPAPRSWRVYGGRHQHRDLGLVRGR